MATSTYRAFPKRPGGVTEWEREDYENADGMLASRYKIHSGEIFCRATIPGTSTLCSNTTGFSGTNILMTHIKKFHLYEYSKLPAKKGGNLKKAEKDAAAVHFEGQLKLINEFRDHYNQVATDLVKMKHIKKSQGNGGGGLLDNNGDDDDEDDDEDHEPVVPSSKKRPAEKNLSKENEENEDATISDVGTQPSSRKSSIFTISRSGVRPGSSSTSISREEAPSMGKGKGKDKQIETPILFTEKHTTPMYRGNPCVSKMRELVGQKSACDVCKEKSRRCPDPTYVGKDEWKGVDWEMADCALIRQFIQPEIDE